MSDPYRSTKHLAVIQREAAYCLWCVHHRRHYSFNQFSHNACHSQVKEEWSPLGISRVGYRHCKEVNPKGHCLDYRPTKTVRFWRLFGKYRPHMIKC